MSISITTVNIGDIFPVNAFNELFPPMNATVLDNSILSALLFPSNLGRNGPIPQIPTPVCTSDFPDTPDPLPVTSKVLAVRCPTKRKRTGTCQDCCICLETVSPNIAATLPCGHAFHRLCLFSLMTYPVLGARSMVHCPMCRYALDRYDIRPICDVSVRRMLQAAQRCKSLRKLINGCHASNVEPSFRVVAKLIQDCQTTTADDGFVYNVALLAIDRALSHHLNFARTLAMQFQSPHNQQHDPLEFISQNLACHVEVLMRTANHVDT